MKKEILALSDSNMAGYEWTWSFYLEKQGDGSYSLCATSEISNPDDDDEPFEIPPTTNLRRGADVYEALDRMLDEAGYSLRELDLEKIASNIATLDERVADHFFRGEALLLRRMEREARNLQKRRKLALAPFQKAIDEYCDKLDDTPSQGGGGVQGASERRRVQAFLEHYVCSNGELPKGHHSWTLSSGYIHGSHDFSDLTNSEG